MDDDGVPFPAGPPFSSSSVSCATFSTARMENEKRVPAPGWGPGRLGLVQITHAPIPIPIPMLDSLRPKEGTGKFDKEGCPGRPPRAKRVNPRERSSRRRVEEPERGGWVMREVSELSWLWVPQCPLSSQLLFTLAGPLGSFSPGGAPQWMLMALAAAGGGGTVMSSSLCRFFPHGNWVLRD